MNRFKAINELLRGKIILLALLSIHQIMTSCSANAPTGSVCERKCGSRPISGGKLRAIPVTNGFDLQCTPPTTEGFASLGTFEYSFLVFEDRSVANKVASDTSSTTIAAETPDRVPMAGVAFYPSIIGITANQDANSKGTDTPSSEWCTDSCGIATIKVSPVCRKQVMQVGIIVPGLTGEPTAAVENPNPSVKLNITFPF